MSRIKDWTGYRRGTLTAIERTDEKQLSTFLWKFRCDCGNEVLRRPSALKRHKLPSCGCMAGQSKICDITGKRFGKLTVVKRLGLSSNRDYNWLCKCDCGEETITTVGRLNHGSTKSCGCLKTEAPKTRTNYHGMKDTPEYKSWCKIKERCLNTNSPDYPRYGGSNITICDEWKNDFKAFYGYMGDKPTPEHSVDRIDNSKGYEPGNVRWASRVEQARNKGMNSNNKSGVKGVSFETKKHPKSDKTSDYWVAQWKTLTGKPQKKCYSIKKYGEELAFFLACEKRDIEIQKLNLQGAGYTDGHTGL